MRHAHRRRRAARRRRRYQEYTTDRSSYLSPVPNWRDRRSIGWERNLYRNTEQGKVAGVCAGLANHFNIDPWAMRCIFIAAFLFFNWIVIFAYILGWVLMSPRSRYSREFVEYDEDNHRYQPTNILRQGRPTAGRLALAQKHLKAARERVERMERYVTSRKFELQNEFTSLNARH